MKTERVNERLKQLIDHYGLTPNAFSKEIKVSGNTVIGRILNTPDRAPSYQVFKMIADRYPEVNFGWFITGIGPMIHEVTVAKSYISYYHLSNSMDFVKAIEGEIKPTSILHIFGFDDCDFAFDVIGTSMGPKFNPGEIILCKKMGNYSVVPGEAFLVITQEYQFIRYFREVTEDGKFVFVAENPDYRPVEITALDLKHMCVIKGKIKRETY